MHAYKTERVEYIVCVRNKKQRNIIFYLYLSWTKMEDEREKQALLWLLQRFYITLNYFEVIKYHPGCYNLSVVYL